MKLAHAHIDGDTAWVVLRGVRRREVHWRNDDGSYRWREFTPDMEPDWGPWEGWSESGRRTVVVPPSTEGLEVPCGTCDGKGTVAEVWDDPCPHPPFGCSGRGTVTRLGVVVEQWRPIRPRTRPGAAYDWRSSAGYNQHLIVSFHRDGSIESRLALVAVAHEVERLPVTHFADGEHDYEDFIDLDPGAEAGPDVGIPWATLFRDRISACMLPDSVAASLAVGDVVLKLGALEWLEEPTTEAEQFVSICSRHRIPDVEHCNLCRMGNPLPVPLSSLMTEGTLTDVEPGT